MDRTISIADQFSVTPGPRYKIEGPFSAELLHEQILSTIIPELIKANGSLTIILDGTFGYGTSFLEEVFGGAVRRYEGDFVTSKITIISEEEPYLIDDISGYIKDARNGK
jgi:hypothetical protein